MNSDRHDPTSKRDYLSLQHIERYKFACAQLRGRKKILDVACGTGYGTMLLANSGFEVTGADIDENQILANRGACTSAAFCVEDVLALSFDSNSFDAVVTFETIEHVANGEEFFAEIFRVLRPGGVVICSTPNIAFTAHPDFHIKEYHPEEFFALAEKKFSNTARYGQYFTAADRAGDLLRRIVGKILRPFGLLGLLKAVFSAMKRRANDSRCAPSNAFESHGDQLYAVVPIEPEKDLLRIMVFKGEKPLY